MPWEASSSAMAQYKAAGRCPAGLHDGPMWARARATSPSWRSLAGVRFAVFAVVLVAGPVRGAGMVMCGVVFLEGVARPRTRGLWCGAAGW